MVPGRSASAVSFSRELLATLSGVEVDEGRGVQPSQLAQLSVWCRARLQRRLPRLSVVELAIRNGETLHGMLIPRPTTKKRGGGSAAGTSSR